MTDNRTSPKVCVITGGSAGVGLATAKRFAAEGFNIALCGRDQEKLAAAKKAIQLTASDNTRCLTAQHDLAERGQARQFGERVLKEFSHVDVLVNNAAVAPFGPFGSFTEEQIDEALAVNIRSLFVLTQLLWNNMATGQGGVVINISSLAAIDPFTGFSLYGATKAWADLLTTALADEGKAHAIRAYSIRPGAVETTLLRNLFPDFPKDQCVQPDDVAEKIWECVARPDLHPSGTHLAVTNQP